MASILMCKNMKVYNIDTERVYNYNLLPGCMQKCADKNTFRMWMKLRYSSNTNSIARQLKGVIFGQGNRVTINKTTYALSLSDCYWMKEETDSVKFEDISPYYNDFWKGVGPYVKGAIPSLYVCGGMIKEWDSSDILYKYGEETYKEVACYELCKACNVSCAEITRIYDGVAVRNITNANIMLEQANMSGKIDVEDFRAEDIIKLFGIFGVRMLVIDAIVGNGDRHAGNFGWLRSSNTGEYLGMAPLYDFDHALDSIYESGRLIIDVLNAIKHNEDYVKECKRIAEIVCSLSTYATFTKRAHTILSCLKVHDYLDK